MAIEKRLTPREFWQTAASWGSALTAGDPGSCLYGFDESGLVQSEEHRQDCIAYIEQDCRKAALANIAAGEDADELNGELAAMLAYLKTAPVEGAMPNLDSFTDAYVTAALWSTNDDSDEAGGSPLDDNYGPEHIAPDSLQIMIAECAHFQKLYGHLLTKENYPSGGYPLERAGHDFWLTRNGHGAGFWDGDWSDPAGDILTKAAKSFGETDLYAGDDGLIHQSNGPSLPEPIANPAPTAPAPTA